MRYSNGRRISLVDFIVDSVYETGYISEDIPVAEVQSLADRICDEVKEHIREALADVDLGLVVE